MKKLTAYPAVRTLLLVPPMFALISVFGMRAPARAPGERREMTAMVFLRVLPATSRADVKERLNTKLTKDTKSNK